ncbi:hypothetical protein BV25DRAFT_1901966 [Artomyces pyxidatus]|uniref:Uncharacterized protein n=1 Tax=Artomyces pyxidatus TaxID=48021 RepID=A0ACB8SQF6_9AGAM|nr:hypothetical protein BV25DRAFT_1901966 [Artomyces pyxidatus]
MPQASITRYCSRGTCSDDARPTRVVNHVETCNMEQIGVVMAATYQLSIQCADNDQPLKQDTLSITRIGAGEGPACTESMQRNRSTPSPIAANGEASSWRCGRLKRSCGVNEAGKCGERKRSCRGGCLGCETETNAGPSVAATLRARRNGVRLCSTRSTVFNATSTSSRDLVAPADQSRGIRTWTLSVPLCALAGRLAGPRNGRPGLGRWVHAVVRQVHQSGCGPQRRRMPGVKLSAIPGREGEEGNTNGSAPSPNQHQPPPSVSPLRLVHPNADDDSWLAVLWVLGHPSHRMVTAFPSPVLAVAADVVRDLDGGDALSGLWTLFTKCKESLQDGRRLENISWRLWYRELASHNQCSRSSSPDIATPTPFFPRHAPPLTPTSENGSRHGVSVSPKSVIPTGPRSPTTSSNGHLEVSERRLSVSSSSSSAGRPLSVRTKSSSSVGKIICDMIPDKLVVAAAKPHPVIEGVSSDINARAPAPEVKAFIVAPLPSMILPPSTPPSGSALFPRVVVVNPTPHPTPPATPTPLASPAVIPPVGQHLLPPPRLSSGAAARQFTATHSDNAPVVPPLPAPLSRVSAPPAALPKPADGTLKLADRRFFLPQDQSPSPERDSQGRGSQGSFSTGKSPSDAGEIQPSSVTSNQTKASNSSKRAGRGRKTKEAVRMAATRPTMTRFPSHRQGTHPLVQRKAAGAEPTKGRATFNVGSVTSNGTKVGAAAGPSRPAPRAPEPTVAPSKGRAQNSRDPPITTAQPHRRSVVVSNSSSEYETEDDSDDDSWASEDASAVEGQQRKPTKDEQRLREAAEEVQRQRELFVKQPQRSYSNLNRTKSGLLSALLNPDPSVLPPGHPYRVNSSHDVGRQPHRSTSSPMPHSQLSTSKSAAALPTTAQVTATITPVNGDSGKGKGSHGGYRPKGRPQGEEMEDDSDSDDENPDDTIQVSRSLAQQKLAALADPNRRRNSDNTKTNTPQIRPVLPTVATAPIPLNHPWNLPAPAPPMTPRTTRRQMLATELSESLRRNLLWERQVSKTSMMGNAPARRGNGLLGNGLRPLTSTTTAEAPAKQAGSGGERSQRSGDSRSGNEADDSDERKRRAMARNRSWADDYHYSGW